MCYSAMVKQRLKRLGLLWNSRVDLALFEETFKLRNQGEKIRFPRAMEFNFSSSSNPAEARIKASISIYHQESLRTSEAELVRQQERLADTERKLAVKPTKTAEKEKGIAERKIEALQRKIDRLENPVELAEDSRIYANDYAPVIILENGERVIKPMRYLLRPMGFDEDFDRRFPGCYNARRDSLQSFWKNQFMHNHGILIISSFFENVKKHRYEQRTLRDGEEPENKVIQFIPDGFEEMIVPIIWDCWSAPGKPNLYSFALITDEPPKEVSDAGHDRCPIFLKKSAVDQWLNPGQNSLEQIQAILDDKEQPFYRNQAVA